MLSGGWQFRGVTQRKGISSLGAGWPGSWAQLAFAALFGLSVVFFFVGLGRSSLWADELFTMWVIGPRDPATVAARIASDVHPPLFYTLAWLWTLVAGVSGAAVRVFSGLCIAAGLLVLVACAPFSRAGRLFAAALAASSPFVFVQSQNARSYGLALMLVTITFIQLLRLLEDKPPARRRLVAAGIFGLLAAFTHAYALLVVLSAMGVAFLLRPAALRGLVPIIIGIGGAYVAWHLLVILRFSLVDVTSIWWIPNTLDWLKWQTILAALAVLGFYGGLAFALCIPGIRHAASSDRTTRDRLILCIATPLVMWIGAAIISLKAPSITDRNLLLASPAMWCLAALLFDAAAHHGARWLRYLTMLTVPLAAMSTTIILARGRPMNEPYREVAQITSRSPVCRNQRLFSVSFYKMHDYFDDVDEFYLKKNQLSGVVNLEVGGFSKADRDLVTKAIATAQSGCSTIAFAVHRASPANVAGAQEYLNQIALPLGYRVVARRVASAEGWWFGDYLILDRIVTTRGWQTNAYLFDLVDLSGQQRKGTPTGS